MTRLPYWKFILPLLLSSPRLFLPVFIGHNISSLSDPTIKGNDRVIKWASNILGIALALAVAWYIYKHTNRRIARINAGLAADESETEEERHQEQYEYQQALNRYDPAITTTHAAARAQSSLPMYSSQQQLHPHDDEELALPMEDIESYHHRGLGSDSYQPLAQSASSIRKG